MAEHSKTNAMRLLDGAHLPYEAHYFENSEALSGVEVADMLGIDRDKVFKTLVTQGKSKEYYVFMVPVACELDLKKAANAVGEKSIAMIKSKELLPLTGYIHGGCSPLGMHKLFTTTIDETADLYDTIYFSGGKIGCQIEMAPQDLYSIIPVKRTDIVVV